MGSLVDKNKYIKGVLFYASSLQLPVVSAPSATFLRCLLVTLNLIIKLMVARINDTFCSMHVHKGFEVTKMAVHAQLLQ